MLWQKRSVNHVGVPSPAKCRSEVTELVLVCKLENFPGVKSETGPLGEGQGEITKKRKKKKREPTPDWKVMVLISEGIYM